MTQKKVTKIVRCPYAGTMTCVECYDASDKTQPCHQVKK